MAIAFRADASDLIGNGHVMRCLTLANTLVENGETCHFICRSITAATRNAIDSAGHTLEVLPVVDAPNVGSTAHAHWLSAPWQVDAAQTLEIVKQRRCIWIVVDHYSLDADWEKIFRSEGFKVGVIDDLADRAHDCDLLLDQNLRENAPKDYADLVPSHAQKLFGLRYLLLRPEFSRVVETSSASTKAKSVLVAFSGADLLHMTLLTLQAQQPAERVTVLISSQNCDERTIEAMCLQSGWNCFKDSNNVADIMQSHDIAIGAGGGMLWERAALGLPSIAIIIAENQRQQVRNAEALGLVLGLDAKDLDLQSLKTAILKLRDDAELRIKMSGTCKKSIDGQGRLRVAERFLISDISLRRADASDSKMMWLWRNDIRIRRFARNAAEITLADHEKWFASTLLKSNVHLLVASDAHGPLGVVRFDVEGDMAEISIYLGPDRLGQGRGAALLLSAEDWLALTLSAALTIRATVLDDNIASQELFRSCGYVFQHGMFHKPVGKTK